MVNPSVCRYRPHLEPLPLVRSSLTNERWCLIIRGDRRSRINQSLSIHWPLSDHALTACAWGNAGHLATAWSVFIGGGFHRYFHRFAFLQLILIILPLILLLILIIFYHPPHRRLIPPQKKLLGSLSLSVTRRNLLNYRNYYDYYYDNKFTFENKFRTSVQQFLW